MNHQQQEAQFIAVCIIFILAALWYIYWSVLDNCGFYEMMEGSIGQFVCSIK